MKYTKPGFAYSGCPEGEGIVVGYVAAELLRFLKSLPAEFEIVEPGNVQVRWPEGYTRGMLEMSADQLSRSAQAAYTVAALRAIAAIAPGPRKRKADLWKHTSGQKMWVYPDDNWHPTNIGWRKVGECEVEE